MSLQGFSKRELIELLHTNDSKLSQILQASDIKPNAKKLYELKPVIDAWISQATAKKNSRLSKDAEHARLLSSQADLKEMEIAKKRKELVERSEIEKDITEILTIVKNRLLLLPNQLTNQVYGLENKLEVKNIINKKVTEALEELARAGESN